MGAARGGAGAGLRSNADASPPAPTKAYPDFWRLKYQAPAPIAASRATIQGHSGNELEPVSATGLATDAGVDCGKIAGAKLAGWPLGAVGGGSASPLDTVLASLERGC
jgi:hypothetical protein